LLCHGTVCVVGKMCDLILQLSKSSIYSTKPPGAYRRIESVAEVKGKLRVLDLKRQDVRNAIAVAENAETLFSSGLANDY
ncbi:hypothetical protein M1V68_22745, partial [Klebsiella pneumoniae]|nr:hypothetical protein [Klebsiella pneumoniae]